MLPKATPRTKIPVNMIPFFATPGLLASMKSFGTQSCVQSVYHLHAWNFVSIQACHLCRRVRSNLPSTQVYTCIRFPITFPVFFSLVRLSYFHIWWISLLPNVNIIKQKPSCLFKTGALQAAAWI